VKVTILSDTTAVFSSRAAYSNRNVEDDPTRLIGAGTKISESLCLDYILAIVGQPIYNRYCSLDGSRLLVS
jgi:hypothetical protein